MNRYLIIAIVSMFFASISAAHESDTITPTGFECKLEYTKGKIVGSGNCVETSTGCNHCNCCLRATVQ